MSTDCATQGKSLLAARMTAAAGVFAKSVILTPTGAFTQGKDSLPVHGRAVAAVFSQKRISMPTAVFTQGTDPLPVPGRGAPADFSARATCTPTGVLTGKRRRACPEDSVRRSFATIDQGAHRGPCRGTGEAVKALRLFCDTCDTCDACDACAACDACDACAGRPFHSEPLAAASVRQGMVCRRQHSPVRVRLWSGAEDGTPG